MIDDSVVASTGTIVTNSCVVIDQGTGESQRLGRKITVKQISWRMDIVMPEFDAVADPANEDVVRIILYQDKQTNGAAAVVGDILESANYQSFNNLANKSRFRTLMDRTYAINTSALASDGAGVVSGSGMTIADTFFKKCNIVIEYDNSGTDGAITTQRSNNIGVLSISKSGIGKFLSQMRIRYSDQG